MKPTHLRLAVAFLILHSAFFIGAARAQKRPELAPTPPMGWNSWNWFGPKITEQEVIGIIDAMEKNGLRDAGFNYIVVDGGWREDFLDANGALIPSADRFPRGIKFLSDYAHSKGFKFGLHTVPGRYDCRGNEIGSLGHEKTHLQEFLDWKLDFIKLDRCRMTLGNNPKNRGWTPEAVEREYTKWSKLLHDCGRDILFSASTYSFADWQPKHTNMARTTGDIHCRWQGGTEFDKNENPKITKRGGFLSIMEIADKNNAHAKAVGNGYWNDPDMMVTGHPELTDEEQKAHFALWCIMTSPLFLGNDPRNMTPQELALLTNKELIAINQDPTGQGTRISSADGSEVWMKKLRNGEYALLLLNRKRAPGDITVNFKALGLPETMQVLDLYNQKDLGPKAEVKAQFPARGSMFIKVTPKK